MNSFTPDLDPRISWLVTNISLWSSRDQWKTFVGFRSWPNSHHASFRWSILVAAMASFILMLLAPCQNTRRSLQGLVAQGHFSFRDEVTSCFLNFRHEEGCPELTSESCPFVSMSTSSARTLPCSSALAREMLRDVTFTYGDSNTGRAKPTHSNGFKYKTWLIGHGFSLTQSTSQQE